MPEIPVIVQYGVLGLCAMLIVLAGKMQRDRSADIARYSASMEQVSGSLKTLAVAVEGIKGFLQGILAGRRR